jgi:hypothetical protein
MQLMRFGKNKTVPSDWVKIYEAFERGTITNVETHEAMDKVRDLELDRVTEKREVSNRANK